MTTGSLQKKKDKWYAVVCFNIDGKQTQKWINTGLPITGNKKNAEKKLNELIYEYSLKQPEENLYEEHTLFCDFLSEWLEIH